MNSYHPFNVLKGLALPSPLPVRVSSKGGATWAGEALTRSPGLAGLGWFANPGMLFSSTGGAAMTRPDPLFPQDGGAPAYESFVFRRNGEDHETGPLVIASEHGPTEPHWRKNRVWTKVRCERLLFVQNCVLRVDNPGDDENEPQVHVDFADAKATWMAPQANKVGRPTKEQGLARPYSGWGDLTGFWADSVVDWRFGRYRKDTAKENHGTNYSVYRQYYADRMAGNPPFAWFPDAPIYEMCVPDAQTVIPSKRSRRESVQRGHWGTLAMPTDLDATDAERVGETSVWIDGEEYAQGQPWHPLTEVLDNGDVVLDIRTGTLWQYDAENNELTPYASSATVLNAKAATDIGSSGLTMDGVSYLADDPYEEYDPPFLALRSIFDDHAVVRDTSTGLYWQYDAKADMMRLYGGTGGAFIGQETVRHGAGGIVLLFEYVTDHGAGEEYTETQWLAVVPRWTDGERFVWDRGLPEGMEPGNSYLVRMVPAEEFALLYRAVFTSPYQKAKRVYKDAWAEYHKVNADYDAAMEEWRSSGRHGPKPQRARTDAEMSAWKNALENNYPRPHDVDPGNNPYEDECGDFWEGYDDAKDYVLSHPPDRFLYWGVVPGIEPALGMDGGEESEGEGEPEEEGDDLPGLAGVIAAFAAGGPFYEIPEGGPVGEVDPVTYTYPDLEETSLCRVLGLVGGVFHDDEGNDLGGLAGLDGHAFDLLVHMTSYEYHTHQRSTYRWVGVDGYGGYQPDGTGRCWLRHRELDYNFSVQAAGRWMKNLPPRILSGNNSQEGA